jgi:hypothetical protein
MLGVTTPLPQYVFIAWCLVKHGDNFYMFSSQWKEEALSPYVKLAEE